MKTVAIAGASGVVGSRALRRLLARDDVERVVAIGRRQLAEPHPKLDSRTVDLRDKAAMAAEIPNLAAAAFCCLGTTMKKAGSKEAFRAIDYDAVLAFGEAALERGAQRFLLVSSIGADPRSGNFYLKTKGETEEALARLAFAQLTVLRPSFIDDEGTRAEYRLGERLSLPVARLVFSIAGGTSRYAPITADALGAALVRLAFDDTSERVRVVQGKELHAAGR